MAKMRYYGPTTTPKKPWMLSRKALKAIAIVGWAIVLSLAAIMVYRGYI